MYSIYCDCLELGQGKLIMSKDKKIYDKVNPSLDFVQKELDIIKFWQDNNIFDKSVQRNNDAPEFSFFDGPPTANGKPHIGHVLTRVVKDVIPRYKTMKGYRVQRKAGWDTHGLPVELEVEKSLGLDGKQDIERYGVSAFIQKCKDSVFTYKSEWERMSERVGYWVDMQDPYVTYDDKYIESVWWSLSQMYDKGLLYKGHKILPYCARCGTSLSSHEVAQGYKDVVDRTAIVAFDIGDNQYIAAWTTTPWTLPSNVALCVHPDYEYNLIETSQYKVGNNNTRVWMACELVSKVFEDYKIIDTVKGSQLLGKRYQPLYSVEQSTNAESEQHSYVVVADKFVTLDSGTGVVHIAPAYGEDDARVGRDNNLKFVRLVGDNGQFESGQFGGLKFKEADKHILRDLKARNLLIKELPYSHSYPHCWRCDSPLMYYARSSWFVAMSKLRDRLVASNNTINWVPSNIGTGRMGNFLSQVIDWGISRERYWGTPLPIWQCECGNIRVVASRAELVQLSGCAVDIELHKPYVDDVTISCDKCSKMMRRTPEVIDCWYDSGSMPFAQYNYPYAGEDNFRATFPADFISEAVDQTRGWFYTLSAISVALFDKAPFRNCIVLGHVLDSKGIKMSKHKGNVVDTWSVLDKQGADAIRWYFLSTSAAWLPSRFSHELVVESSRKFIGTLWNVYSFYVLYANIDNFDPTRHKLNVDELGLMDKWILSCSNTLIETVDAYLSEYKLIECTKVLSDYCDQLSNWYIRRSRDRFWSDKWDIDKCNAYMTLYTVLTDLIKLSAPFVPFVCESIYLNIVKRVDSTAPQSVHLCEYPSSNSAYIDKQLQDTMRTVLTIVENGRAARSQHNIKNRQPLYKAYVGGQLNLSQELTDIVKEELNIKNIELVVQQGRFLTYECKPQLRTLGAKYGKNLNVVKQYLLDNSAKIVQWFGDNPDGVFVDSVGDVNISLSKDDVLTTVKSAPGYASVGHNGVVVALDTTLTEELIAEGFVREIVSKIQNIRKESNFDVTDRISICYKTSAKLDSVVEEYKATIMKDTLCQTLTMDNCTSGVMLDINGEKFECLVKVVG